MSSRIVLLGILLVIMACNGQKKAVMGEKNIAAVNDSLQLLVKDDYSGADVQETLVIKNEKALKVFYSKINRTRKPGLPLPEIDFAKDMVIVHCSGARNDGSWPELFVMQETDSELIFVAKHDGNKESNTAITTPFSLYKMPLTEKAIVFDSLQK